MTLRIAFFLLFMGLLVLMYLICSLRTNVVFMAIFLFLDIALFLLTFVTTVISSLVNHTNFVLARGAYWKASKGDMKTFHTLEVASGANVFVFCVL